MNKSQATLWCALVATVFVASNAGAADAEITATGLPTQIRQGETVTFLIGVSATGIIHKDNVAAAVNVLTSYTPGGLPTDAFTCPLPPSENGIGNSHLRYISDQQYEVDARIVVPSDLPVGTYTIQIQGYVTGSVFNPGLNLTSSTPFVHIEVLPSIRPSGFEIYQPHNAWMLRKEMTTMAIMSPKLPVTNVEATLNGEPVEIKFNVRNGWWTGDLELTKKGMNVYMVEADTSKGRTRDVVVFYAAWDIIDHPTGDTITVEAGKFLFLKFRVADWEGYTSESVPLIYVDGVVVGQAIQQTDEYGPYYRYNYLALHRVGSKHVVEIKLDDGVTVAYWTLQIVKPLNSDGS